MVLETDQYDFPYPEPGDANDVALWIKNLAQRAEAVLVGLRNTAANVPGLRALGTGSLQAAPGNHTHPSPPLAAANEVAPTDSIGQVFFSFGRTFPSLPVVVASGGNGELVSIGTVQTDGFIGIFRYANEAGGYNPLIANGPVRCLWHAYPSTK